MILIFYVAPYVAVGVQMEVTNLSNRTMFCSYYNSYFINKYYIIYFRNAFVLYLSVSIFKHDDQV
jgi:hypothetical protein